MRFLAGLLLSIPLIANAAISAQAYIVTEMDGTVILEKNADDVRPIASITKLFTTRGASLYDENELITIEKEDVKAGRMRTSPLKIGQSYTRGTLIELALVSSDNVAAIALGRANAAPPAELPPNTHIVEASGLDPLNVSTARELASIARALSTGDLAKTSVTPFVTIGTSTKHSTNPLLTRSGWAFHLSKTGFINQSGGCLVVVFEMGDRLVTAVVLGSKSVRERWKDLYEIRKQLDPDEAFAAPTYNSAKAVTKRKRRYKS